MNYQQVIPTDITKLSRYSVPGEQFVCTCIVLILLLLLSLVMAISSIIRTFKGFTNTDYSTDFAVKYEANKTFKNIATNEEDIQDLEFVNSCRKWSRWESRLLEFWCLIVIVAINIGTYTCNIMEAVGFFAALFLFLVFNFFRISQNRILRSLWVVPLVVCYLPYYIFHKSLFIQ